MGLLSRASTLDDNKNQGLAFFEFIKKYSIQFCALLEKEENNYFVSSSLGFDAASICSAKSTIDFWNGICKESNQLYSFKDNEINQFLQLFSFDLKDNIHEISVYKRSDSKIFLSAGILPQASAADLDKIYVEQNKSNISSLNPFIKKDSNVLLLTIDFLEAARAFYDGDNNSVQSFDSFLPALRNEIYNRFICTYNVSNSTVINNSSSIKTIFIEDKTYSIDLIKHHIILNLKEVLGPYAEQIQITFSGTADSVEKIKSFLQAE